MKAVKRVISIMLVIFTAFMPLSAFAFKVDDMLSEAQINKIESFIEMQMKESKIPGISIVVVSGDKTIYKNGFGYSDIKEKTLVSSDTLFELGSATKAFTALGILKLEKNGLLNLSDTVDKYIPWLKLTYNGKEITIKIEHLLTHTSGIPFDTIDSIPEDSSPTALENTVRNLIGTKLESLPGTHFTYATINYDILGLIIEKISGQSYENFMKNNIISQMNLDNTYVGREQDIKGHLSKGYKVGFLKVLEYNAPIYKGNNPAGYIITNANDMEKWLKIQLGTSKANDLGIDSDLIARSHQVNNSVQPVSSRIVYTNGWYLRKSDNTISHDGNNPNYSSYILFNRDKQIGIAVLANLDSDNTRAIGDGVLNIIEGMDRPLNTVDRWKQMDKMAVVIIFVATILMLVCIFLIIHSLIEIKKGIRKKALLNFKHIMVMILQLVFVGAGEFCLYKIPSLLVGKLSWGFINVWAPKSIIVAAWEVAFTLLTLYVYVLLTNMYKKQDKISYFSIIFFSILSAAGNSLFIFTINTAINSNNMNYFQLLSACLLGVFLNVIGLRVSGAKLGVVTNDIVYKFRMQILTKLLKSSYEDVEKIEHGKIQAALNNDTEMLSTLANLVTRGVTDLLTLIACCIYLSIINLYALLFSLLAITIISSIYYLVGRSANKLFEGVRDIQNRFFKCINDLIGGNKELSINEKKREEFLVDVEKTCNEYRKKRYEATLKFLNVNVAGELLFTSAIVAVVFVMPLIIKGIQSSNLRSYVFILLFLTGPVNGILRAIPNLLQVRISWNRINLLIKRVSSYKDNQNHDIDSTHLKDISIKLNNIEYEYISQDNSHFKIGPINYEFNTGEIIFITGGNGSGKSTLAKVITGLYTQSGGHILVNKGEVSADSLGQYFSTIFSDFYIFDKLYGVEHQNKREDIEKYLNILQIADKLTIENGVFSTTKLSTGQRKRLALLISYLEDKPFCLFDEWAADQDPEFRRFFYMELLPGLKNRGKCVIVITHDDSYFHTADKIIKMEYGKIIHEASLSDRL